MRGADEGLIRGLRIDGARPAAAPNWKHRRLVCRNSAVTVRLGVSSKRRVRARLIPSALWNVPLCRNERSRVVGRIEKGRLLTGVIKVGAADRDIERGGREATYLKSCGCGIRCNQV